MKKFFATILIAAASLTASAQTIYNDPLNQSRLGVRLNYELSCPTDITASGFPGSFNLFGNGSGFSVEGIYNTPVWQNLYFEPGVGIFYNTLSISTADEDGVIFNGSARQWGIRIPLNVGYRFDILDWLSVSLFTGPEFNLAIYGRTHFNVDKYSLSGPLYGKDGCLNRADIKWRFGIGATFNKKYTLAISGAAGICDSYRNGIAIIDNPETGNTITTNLKRRTNLFTVSLGYLF